MKIGFSASITADSVDVAVLAQKGEELGYDSFWIGEQPVFPVTSSTTPPYGSSPDFMAHMVDAFISLARVSGITKQLKLGTAICLIPEQNPSFLLKKLLPWITSPAAGSYSVSERAG